jgi:hypothetical protein
VKTLRLSYNELSGSLPSTWVQPPANSTYSIATLDLRYNEFSGTLPNAWGSGFPVSTYMWLNDNMLTGAAAIFILSST